jgi:hypothetical protein
LQLPKPYIIVQVDGGEIKVKSPVPVKGLTFDLTDDDVSFEDNCLDLEPVQEQVIIAEGLNRRLVTFLHLGTAY